MALLAYGVVSSSCHRPRPGRTPGVMPHALRVAVAIAVISGAVVAVADPVAGGDLNADTRALVAQLTAERAITLAKERRLADGAQEELYHQLAAKDRALRAARAQATGNAAERERARKERDEIARQRQELVAALEQRDRTWLHAKLATMAMPSTRELLELDVQTRLKLIDELWESIVNDLNDPSKPNSLPISDATRALLEERRREYRADPSSAVPWEDVHAQLLRLV